MKHSDFNLSRRCAITGHDPDISIGPSLPFALGREIDRRQKTARHQREFGPPRHRILLLQGPVGPFFKNLQEHLDAVGFETFRVCFNAADVAFSSRLAWTHYDGDDPNWAEWLGDLLDRVGYKAIVLFGCERARHSEAIAAAKARNIPVISLEEGYIRPGYVTAEYNGNNRRSPLATMPTAMIMNEPTAAGALASTGSAFNKMIWFGLLYYVLRVGGGLFYRSATHHKNRPLASETFYWARNAWRKVFGRSKNARTIRDLIKENDGNYYLVPLQVRDDGQMLQASKGWSNERLISEAIASFASNAPVERHLVFKVHPLERGHSSARQQVRQLAKLHGCGSRVTCIDDGPLGLLTKHAVAMLTINSTSAFSAIAHGIPLGVLGDAMYSRPGLARCLHVRSDLDAFWSDGELPDQVLAKAFLKRMVADALVPGDFYIAGNRKVACVGIASKISSAISDASFARQSGSVNSILGIHR